MLTTSKKSLFVTLFVNLVLAMCVASASVPQRRSPILPEEHLIQRGLFPTFLNAETLASAQAANQNAAEIEATAANTAEATSFNAAETDVVSPGGFWKKRGLFGFGGNLGLAAGRGVGLGAQRSGAAGIATPFAANTFSNIGQTGLARGAGTSLARVPFGGLGGLGGFGFPGLGFGGLGFGGLGLGGLGFGGLGFGGLGFGGLGLGGLGFGMPFGGLGVW